MRSREGAAVRAAILGVGVSGSGRGEDAGRPARLPADRRRQVLRIKHLLLVEGLTLAGARRKLDDEAMPVGAEQPAMAELVGKNARERLTAVKRGLRSILDLIGSNGETREFRLSPPVPTSRTRSASTARAKPPRRKPAASSSRQRSAQKSRPRRRT